MKYSWTVSQQHSWLKQQTTQTYIPNSWFSSIWTSKQLLSNLGHLDRTCRRCSWNIPIHSWGMRRSPKSKSSWKPPWWKRYVTVYVLHCTVLYCTILHSTVLYCTVLYCTVLHRIISCCTVLHCKDCTIPYCKDCTIVYNTHRTKHFYSDQHSTYHFTTPLSYSLSSFSIPSLLFFFSSPVITYPFPCHLISFLFFSIDSYRIIILHHRRWGSS